MRLLYVILKKDGRRMVESRDEHAFDYRDEAGPFAIYEEADAARTKIAEAKGWAVVRPPAFLSRLVGL